MQQNKEKRDLSSLKAAGYYCFLKSRPNLQNEENREANKTIFTQKRGAFKNACVRDTCYGWGPKNWRSLFHFRNFKVKIANNIYLSIYFMSFLSMLRRVQGDQNGDVIILLKKKKVFKFHFIWKCQASLLSC